MANALLPRLKVRIPEETDDALLDAMLEEAGDFILSYTKRKVIPASLHSTQVQIATIYYNRLGMEGEKSHTEGGEGRGIDSLPADIAGALRPYMLAKVGF